MAWTRQQGLVPYKGFEKVRGAHQTLWADLNVEWALPIFKVHKWINSYVAWTTGQGLANFSLAQT